MIPIASLYDPYDYRFQISVIGHNLSIGKDIKQDIGFRLVVQTGSQTATQNIILYSYKTEI